MTVLGFTAETQKLEADVKSSLEVVAVPASSSGNVETSMEVTTNER